jgi:tight adherence protein B
VVVVRGAAVLVAAAAAWILATGWAPTMTMRRPALPAPWVLPAALGAGLGAGLLSAAWTGVASVAIAVGLLASSIPVAIDTARRRRRREAVAAAWPDFLALLQGRVAAGATLPDAFVAAAERSPEPIQSAATAVADSVMFGDGFGPALERLATALDDATADRVLATIGAAHRSGGGRVGQILSSLGTSVADELRLRRAHVAALTEQRMTALVALVAPWALLVLTIVTNPQSATAYATHTGTVIVLVGLVSTVVGYLIARRTARLSQPPRVFK